MRKKAAGFTLVELLVVVSIIAILVAMAIGTYSSFQKKGRDTKRQSDLNVIQSALEQYHADQGFYPVSGIIDADVGITNLSGRPAPLPLPRVVTYLQQIPRDPLQSPSDTPPLYYRYVSIPNGCNNSSAGTGNYCTNYCLWTCLENPTLSSIPSICSAFSPAGKCSPLPYNFAITQP